MKIFAHNRWNDEYCIGGVVHLYIHSIEIARMEMCTCIIRNSSSSWTIEIDQESAKKMCDYLEEDTQYFFFSLTHHESDVRRRNQRELINRIKEAIG